MKFQELILTSGEGVLRFAYLLIVTIAIIVGNVLVIVAVGKFKKLRKTTNIMLASLAVADLLVGVVTVPLYIAWTMHPDIFDRSSFLCRSALLSSLLVVAASQISLLVLSVERYLAVCAPLKHRDLMIRCPWLHVLVIFLTWVISITTTALASLSIKSDYRVCNYYNAFHRFFLFFAVIFGIFIPFIAIIFMNIKVFLSVLKYEMRRQYLSGDNSDCVRNVTDSSDEEIRVAVYNPECNSAKKRHSLVNVEYCGLCLSYFKSESTSLPGNTAMAKDEVLANGIKDASSGQTAPGIPLKKVCLSTNLTDDGVDDNLSDDVFVENEEMIALGQFTNQENVVAGNGNYENEDFIKEQSPQSFKEQLFDPETSTHSLIEATVKEPCETENNRDFNEYKMDHQDVNSSYQNIKACCMSLDHLSFLGSTKSPSLSKKTCSHVTCQLPFHMKIYRKIETLATPRILRKRNYTEETQKTKPWRSSVDLSLRLLYKKNYIVEQVDDELNHIKYSSLMKIENETVKYEETTQELEEKNVFSMTAPLLPNVGDVSETLSLQDFEDVSTKSQHVSTVSNVELKKTIATPIQIEDSCQGLWGFKRSNIKRWLSNNLSHARDESRCQIQKRLSETNLMSDCKPLTPTNSVTDTPSIWTSQTTHAQGTVDLKRHRSSSTLHLRGNTSKAICHFSNLGRKQSLPTFSVSASGCETNANGTLSTSRRRLLPDCTGVTRSHRVSVSQTKPYSRKMSSIREGAPKQTAYVSKKVARTVSLVCFSFIIAWLPFFSVIIINTFCATCDLVYFLNVVLMITFAQSASNPVIYALCHASFRSAYKNLFTQMCHK